MSVAERQELADLRARMARYDSALSGKAGKALPSVKFALESRIFDGADIQFSNGALSVEDNMLSVGLIDLSATGTLKTGDHAQGEAVIARTGEGWRKYEFLYDDKADVWYSVSVMACRYPVGVTPTTIDKRLAKAGK